MNGRIWVVDWGSDQISALWLLLLRVPVSLDVSWQVTVSGVVNVLKREEVVWLVELVQGVVVSCVECLDRVPLVGLTPVPMLVCCVVVFGSVHTPPPPLPDAGRIEPRARDES